VVHVCMLGGMCTVKRNAIVMRTYNRVSSNKSKLIRTPVVRSNYADGHSASRTMTRAMTTIVYSATTHKRDDHLLKYVRHKMNTAAQLSIK
jgi:hypothetical protein